MSYLAIAKAAEARLKLERDPEAVLADLYQRYWTLSATDEPMTTFRSLHCEIDLLENQVGVEAAWRTLEASARRWYEERRACPFCRHPGVLHLSERP